MFLIAEKGIEWHIDVSSVVWTLINNGKLANRTARFVAIVVKKKKKQFLSVTRQWCLISVLVQSQQPDCWRKTLWCERNHLKGISANFFYVETTRRLSYSFSIRDRVVRIRASTTINLSGIKTHRFSWCLTVERLGPQRESNPPHFWVFTWR